ncbi:protein NRT1/ PTR FAMILY 5.5-like [Camellia sinensis]|uniref:protein NRT1/ PTR FAMILY 5.5-like n=1 Tax=Camellia sinensis TaxID=4442 RepID=UPI001036862F|nr:protein NRT1/ PTR FAMILY 5.5-like [Camellia sinensis]
MVPFVRILVLIWADILAMYAMWMMMLYLTNVWKLNFTHAAAIINVFWGLMAIMVLPIQFLVDAFMGSYWMLLISSFSYSAGFGFLTMSTPPVLAKATGTCSLYEPECIGEGQKILFYTALVLIALGLSGHLISLTTFMTEQVTEEVVENISTRSCITMFVASYMAIFVVIGGVVAISYIRIWSIRFGIPAICTVVATLIFLSGSGSYNCVKPRGSSLTTVFRVLVAATSKMFCKCPEEADGLYETRDDNVDDVNLVPHSRRLRCLDKAAIILPTKPLEEQQKKRWKLCRVTDVEETKLTIRMIPLCMTFIFCGVVSSIGNTYFIEQANHMNHKLGKISIPIVILLWFHDQGKQQFANLYYKLANKLGGSGARHYAPLIGIAVSMVFAILCCITAAKVETRRLNVVRTHGLIDKPEDRIPMSVFWLLPQFVLIGALNGILENSIVAIFIDQVGPSMRAYVIHFGFGVVGLGSIGSVLSVYVAGKVSERGGKQSWFQDTLNHSRLDKYYWTLAWLSAVNLGLYIVTALFYRFRKSELEDPQSELEDEDAPHYQNTNAPFKDNARCCC